MTTQPLPDCLQQFQQLYRVLNEASVVAMADIYDLSVVFTDPVHQIKGLPGVQAYTRALLGNVHTCGFDCRHWIVDGDHAVVQWLMHLQHPSLRKGALISVNGVSRLHINADGKIDEHEDFYDLGAMVYEHVPLLGAVVRGVKRRLGGDA